MPNSFAADVQEPSTGARVKSLVKALHLLECFTIQRPELGVTELAEELGISKSSTHSIIATFEDLGYLIQLPNKKYALGLRMLEYSYLVNQRLGYPKAVYDLAWKAASLTDQIVYFGLPYGQRVLYLYVAHPEARMKDFPYREMLGETALLCSTGIGRAILSHMPVEQWEERIPSVIPRDTSHTIVDRARILDELRRSRIRGYAVDDRGRGEELRCVGVPVFSSSGRLVAGLSTSGPVSSMTDEKLLECADILKSVAAQMRERIYP